MLATRWVCELGAGESRSEATAKQLLSALEQGAPVAAWFESLKQAEEVEFIEDRALGAASLQLLRALQEVCD
jgi:hypothetical protein